MKKRLISTLLVVSMVFSMAMTTSISADEEVLLPFTDVVPGKWYVGAVAYAYTKGLMTGKSEDKFQPTAPMTRAEAVTILARLAQFDDAELEVYVNDSDFLDVDIANGKKWYAAAVGWAAHYGVVSGYAVDGGYEFRPNNAVKRDELAKMLVEFLNNDAFNFMEITGESLVEGFVDEDVFQSWAKSYIDQVRKWGLLKGDNEGNFNPKKTANRAEIATILERFPEYDDRDPMCGALDGIFDNDNIPTTDDNKLWLVGSSEDALTMESIEKVVLGGMGLDPETYSLNIDEAQFSEIKAIFAVTADGSNVSVELTVSVTNKVTGEQTESKDIPMQFEKDSNAMGDSLDFVKDELHPEATEPEATEPEATEPGATEPEATEPEATEPEATEPGATEPEATEPGATESEATEPEVTEPETTEPEATEPETTEFAYNAPVPISTFTEAEYSLCNDADFYVSPNGDDANDGKTPETPFATFARAKEAVREFKTTAVSDIVVAFMAGEYKNTNVVFTSEDSGDGVTVTYCAYGDGEVEFNNGLIIDASDFQELNAADRAILPNNAEEYVKKYDLSGYISTEDVMSVGVYNNGETMITARYPNRDMSTGRDSLLIGKTSYVSYNQISPALMALRRINSYHTLDNVYFYGHIGSDSYFENSLVEYYDSDTSVVTLSNLSRELTGEIVNGNTSFIIVNVSEELNAKGEYYIDHETLNLYVYDPEGKYEIACNTEEIIRVEGASNITFRGLSFSCAAGDEILDSTEAPYASEKVEALIRENSAIYTDTASNFITFDGCSFSKMSNVYAIFLDGSNISFNNNEVFELAGGAIYSDCGDENAYDMLQSMNKIIDNNCIHDTGVKYRSHKLGIYSHDVGATISHNEFYNIVHSALELVGVETVVEYNYIHDCNYNGNGSAVYSGMAHTRVGNEVRYNIFACNPGEYHIYLDDGLSGISVYGNVFYTPESQITTAIGMVGGRENRIFDNIIINANDSAAAGLMNIDAKFYDLAVDDALDSYDGWLKWMTLNQWPTAGSDGEQIWREKYPWLFEIDYDYVNWADVEKQENSDYFINPANVTVTNNYAFVSLYSSLDYCYSENSRSDGCRVAELGDVFNNIKIDNTTNPLFTDPAAGDYSIRKDCDSSVIDKIPYIPYEYIGRY